MAEKKQSNRREKAITTEQWQKLNPPASDKRFHFPTFTELKILVVYLFICIVLLQLLDLVPVPNEKLYSLLGQSPPLLWLNIAFTVYFCSEFILMLSRKRTTDTDRHAVKQVLFLAGFFVFYWFAEALQQHFALFVGIGIVLQLGEAFIRANARFSAEDCC